MDLGHKFLAFKNAMNNNYKMNNFITAANFARLILELEPTGVRNKNGANLNFIDIRFETGNPAADEKILSSFLSQGYERTEIEL
jgi:hypothetical protein